jgi:hypothetical protein
MQRCTARVIGSDGGVLATGAAYQLAEDESPEAVIQSSRPSSGASSDRRRSRCGLAAPARQRGRVGGFERGLRVIANPLCTSKPRQSFLVPRALTLHCSRMAQGRMQICPALQGEATQIEWSADLAWIKQSVEVKYIMVMSGRRLPPFLRTNGLTAARYPTSRWGYCPLEGKRNHDRERR